MICPKCEYPRVNTIETDHPKVKGRSVVWRRKECPKCGYRFSTYELATSRWELGKMLDLLSYRRKELSKVKIQIGKLSKTVEDLDETN